MSTARPLTKLGVAAGAALTLTFAPWVNPAAWCATLSPPAAPAVPAPTFASQRELARWTLTVLEGIFRDEARDDPWATAREAEIQGAKGDKRLAGASFVDVACRSTLCRVVVSLDPAQARRTLHALTVTPPLNTSGFHGVDPDDPSRIRLYVSREGTVLMEHPAFAAALLSRGESTQGEESTSP